MQKNFFRVVSPAQFAALLEDFPLLAAESVLLGEAFGRRLAGDFIAPEDLPARDRSCMDGYAVRAADVFGAGEANPAYLERAGEIEIGTIIDAPLAPGECYAIVTGASLPPGADAVVMVEHTQDLGAGTIEIRKSGAPGDHVMLRGEDARASEPVLPSETLLRAQEIGLLAALGVVEVNVFGKPRVGILSTGDELVPVENAPAPGKIRDVNSHALACLVREGGGEPQSYGLVRDDRTEIEGALNAALAENDVVLISGGSSVGARDYTLAAMEALPDAEILAHGVAISPGKPTILARAGKKAVFGLPGQVTSAQVVMLIFGLPFLARLSGDAGAFSRKPPSVAAELSRNIASKPGREDHVRVRLEERDGLAPLAHPVLGKSGLLRTMLKAHALIRIPADEEGLVAGTIVEARLV